MSGTGPKLPPRPVTTPLPTPIGVREHPTYAPGEVPESALMTAPTANLADEMAALALLARAMPEQLAHSETTDLGALIAPGGLKTIDSTPPEMSRPAGAEPANGGEAVGRYSVIAPLGRGGMGQVLAVHDASLDRELAIKILLPAEQNDEARTRFLDEAQMTAQLQHPGVVPVHEIGELSDGRAYFTMQVVRGRTLRALTEDYHGFEFEPGTLFRLISIFHQVCETIAYAHRHGVIHRDLKPDNVMVGEFGEVRVLDWGLAKRIDSPDDLLLSGPSRAIRTIREVRGVHETHAGEIMGTPCYMSPEQARGQNDQLTRASDVFSLGSMLYSVLAGRVPFDGAHAMAVMMRVVGGLRLPLEGRHPIPRGLQEICDRAMSMRPEDRYPEAGALARAVADWLSGTQQRERALQLVSEARYAGDALAPMWALVEDALGHLAACREAAEQAPGDEALQLALWAAEDAADSARLAHDRQRIRREQLLHSALTQSPDLAEARTLLAQSYRDLHADAEARHDRVEMLRTEMLLREQAEGLPPGHPDRAALLEYLAGEGLLTLETDPPGAEIRWHRFVAQGRRLVPVLERELRRSPLRRHWLPQGSHLMILQAEGGPEVRYPVLMGRLGRWDGTLEPGRVGSLPETVMLPPHAAIGPGDVFVAAGPFTAGGDPAAQEAGPKRLLHLPSFAIRREPVTNGEYLAFMNDLALQGQAEAALRFAPRIGGGAAFTWRPDLPVVLVDRACAEAFATWLSRRDGLPWRLPTALEWEKAARGVDGRAFPWGDFYHPGWANLRDRGATSPGLAPVSACPVDESPYGVRGMAGNIREWTSDTLGAPGAQEGILKGGGYLDVSVQARTAGRQRARLDHRDAMTGFRLARSM